MRNRITLVMVLLFLLGGLAVAVPSPGEITESPADSVSAGDEIRVYWRWRDSSADRTNSKGHFDARTTLKAGDGGGYLSGAAIHEALKVLKYPPAEVWALDVRKGAKPNETIPGIQVTDSESEFYDNYTCRDEAGTVYLFLDLVSQ